MLVTIGTDVKLQMIFAVFLLSTVIYASDTRTVRNKEKNYVKCFEMCLWQTVDKIGCKDRLTNKNVLWG